MCSVKCPLEYFTMIANEKADTVYLVRTLMTRLCN